MPKFDVQELVAPLLAQGEELLGWARVNYSGQTEPPALRRTGIVSIGETEARDTPEATVTFPAHRHMVIALTGARILAYTLSITGKPKAYIGEVPMSMMIGATFEPSRMGGVLSIDMVSLANVQLDVAEGDGGGFARELTASIESQTP